MQLKRRGDISWHDLPRIESPFFARSWVERHVNINEPGLSLLFSFCDIFGHGRKPHQRWDQRARDRLLEEVERAEVFLVHGLDSEPFMPLVRHAGDEDGEGWVVDESLTGLVLFNVQWMLGDAVRSHVVSANVSNRQPEPEPEPEPEPLLRPNPPEPVPRTILRLRIRDYTGKALANESYYVYQNGGLVASGSLDDRGYAEITTVRPGQPCEVEIPDRGLHLDVGGKAQELPPNSDLEPEDYTKAGEDDESEGETP